MRSLLFVLLLLASPAFAEGTVQDSDGLPVAGATINLKPTHTGYEAEIVLPAEKYTDATLSSSDPIIKPVLSKRFEMQEATPPVPASQVDADKPSTPAGQAQPKAPTSFAKLVTVVLTNGAIPQGQYRFTLKLAGAAPVSRDLVLAVPASRLDPLDTLVVVSEWAKPSAFGEALTANQPQIWETSQKGWLTHLKLDQKGQTDAGADPAGRIKPKSANLADVGLGQNGLILLGRDYALDGSFPLGTAKGKLVLSADQLADPVTFNFEVRSRIWVVWLFVPMLIGLALGYGARTGLANFLAVSQEKDRCYDLLALIDQTLAQDKDPTFQTAAKAARADALAAVRKKKVDEIKQATDTAQTKFQDARNALAKSRSDLRQTIAGFSAVVRASYHLPQAIKNSLENARSNIDAKLNSDAAFNNVTAAQADFDSVRSAVKQTTVDEGGKWVKAAGDLSGVIDLIGPAFGLAGTDELRAKLKAIVDPVRDALKKLNDDTTSDTKPLKDAFDALHSNIYALQQFRDSVSSAVTQQIVHLEQILSGKPLPKRPDWDNWIVSAKAFAAALQGLAAEGPDVAALSAAGVPLAEGLRAALQAQVSDDAARTQIETLLKENKVIDAVTKVAELVRPRGAVGEGEVKGPVPQMDSGQVVAEATTPTIQAPNAVPAAPMVSVAYPAAVEPDASAIQLIRARNRGITETAGFLQTALFGVVIVGAGYFLFADKWIGTPADFAAVLFWAFGTDIGADAAATAAKAYKKPA